MIVIDGDGKGVGSVVKPNVRTAFYLHSLVYSRHAREDDAVRRSVLHYVIQVDQVPADFIRPPLVMIAGDATVLSDSPVGVLSAWILHQPRGAPPAPISSRGNRVFLD